jgi:hypothetical protein
MGFFEFLDDAFIEIECGWERAKDTVREKVEDAVSTARTNAELFVENLPQNVSELAELASEPVDIVSNGVRDGVDLVTTGAVEMILFENNNWMPPGQKRDMAASLCEKAKEAHDKAVARFNRRHRSFERAGRVYKEYLQDRVLTALTTWHERATELKLDPKELARQTGTKMPKCKRIDTDISAVLQPLAKAGKAGPAKPGVPRRGWRGMDNLPDMAVTLGLPFALGGGLSALAAPLALPMIGGPAAVFGVAGGLLSQHKRAHEAERMLDTAKDYELAVRKRNGELRFAMQLMDELETRMNDNREVLDFLTDSLEADMSAIRKPGIRGRLGAKSAQRAQNANVAAAGIAHLLSLGIQDKKGKPIVWDQALHDDIRTITRFLERKNG